MSWDLPVLLGKKELYRYKDKSHITKQYAITKLLTFCVSEPETSLNLTVTNYLKILAHITYKTLPFKTIIWKIHHCHQ